MLLLHQPQKCYSTYTLIKVTYEKYPFVLTDAIDTYKHKKNAF